MSRSSRFWLVFLLSLLITPPALCMGIASAGAGHGDLVGGRLLFPYACLLRGAGPIDSEVGALAILQIPFYGVILGIGATVGWRGFWAVLAMIALVHTVAVWWCF